MNAFDPIGVQSQSEPDLLPLFGFLGFMAAFFNSIWIILSIWRAGKDYQ